MSEGNNSNNKDEIINVTKGLSVTPALTGLFKPTLDMFGIEIRDFFKGKIETWKEKRKRHNLQVHVAAVHAEIAGNQSAEERPPNVYQQALFEEWAENVGDVDPEDNELSALWRGLLVRAAKGERIADEVRNALKSLSPREAEFLVRLEDRDPGVFYLFRLKNERERYLANQLLGKGLVQRDYSSSVMIMMSWVIVSFIVANYFERSSADLMAGLFLGTAITALLLSAFGRFSLARWRLSWLGRELLGLVHKK